MTLQQPTRLQTTEVNVAGLMEVLGKHLYSTPLVAIRELIQNAHDSCIRRRLEDPAAVEPEIRLRPAAAAGTLTFLDSGAGLTHAEVVRYLATIGSGYTRELRDELEDESLIGYFGLGFLTAYIISQRVTVTTCSYQTPGEAWRFDTQDGQRYGLTPVATQGVGTRVVLHLADDFLDLGDPQILDAVLARYCCLLELPVYLGDSETPVNRAPPWRLDPADHTELRLRKLRLEFAGIFERYFEPLCTLPLVADDGDPQGLLWIQDRSSYATSDCRNLAVFVRGMLVAENERDLLPAWAGFAGGVLESAELKPTASHEDVQRDAGFRRALDATTRTLTAGLAHLARHEPETWRAVQLRHNEALLGAAVSDPELWEAVADLLTLPTSEGDLTVPEILERTGGRLYLSLTADSGPEEMRFRALGEPVIQGHRFGAAAFAATYAEARGVHRIELGTRDAGDALFVEAAVNDRQRRRLEQLFHSGSVAVVPSRFQPRALPLVLVPDRDAELKRLLESDEADVRISQAALGLARLHTENLDQTEARLFVNLDSPLITRLLGMPEETAKAAATVLRAVADLGARRGGRRQVVGPLERLTQALETLLQQAAGGPDRGRPNPEEER